MKRWALTGGIGSGKSTVGRLFADLGVPVIDADAVYHGLLVPQGDKPSALVQALSGALSIPDLVLPDHTLNRRALAAQVFADPATRHTLEAITHPAIAVRASELFAALEAQGHVQGIYDVPLLFEKNMQDRFAASIVVWVPAAVQLQRLMQRDNLSEAEAKARIAAQLPLDIKRDRADFVIDNSGPRQQTQQRVHELWLDLTHRAAQQQP